jgi:hypothetical protein
MRISAPKFVFASLCGEWMPVPYVDTRKAEELFRYRVLRLLKDRESPERIELLLSWRRSGFSIDDSVRIPAGELKGLEDVARYMLRAPVSLSRMRWNRSDKEVFYIADRSHDEREDPSMEGQRIDRLEFLARVITQIPEPRRHLLFYYGHYAQARLSQPSPASSKTNFAIGLNSTWG